jgi:ABC-type polysaccharide/polyol phosphate transport system ATPase subunit
LNPVVECKDIWKSYHQRPRLGVKEFLLKRKITHPSRFAREWALREVSFSVDRGRAFGIVGHNGTGKSTLLGLLLGTIVPDRGTARVRGRVASLLEINAGFHPELTGGENIYLFGSILGMTLREIRGCYDRIVEFSELEDAIDNPIRTYSNGMITRLGFSTVVHAPAEVLLIDEILGVGDARFQAKCRRFLREFKARNGTLVIVSHNLAELAELCDEGVCMELGSIVRSGPMDEVIGFYRSRLVESRPGTPVSAVT